MHAITLPCPGCTRTIALFHLIAMPDAKLTLRATCHPCRQITELVVTFDDLRDLALGKEVNLRPSDQPLYVM